MLGRSLVLHLFVLNGLWYSCGIGGVQAGFCAAGEGFTGLYSYGEDVDENVNAMDYVRLDLLGVWNSSGMIYPFLNLSSIGMRDGVYSYAIEMSCAQARIEI